jgi:hypothetical protein
MTPRPQPFAVSRIRNQIDLDIAGLEIPLKLAEH